MNHTTKKQRDPLDEALMKLREDVRYVDARPSPSTGVPIMNHTHTAELALAYSLGWLAAALFADITTMLVIAVVGVLHCIINSMCGGV